MTLNAASKENGGLVIFELSGELTREATPALDAIRARAAAQGTTLLLDFANVTHFTSAGLGLLLELLHDCFKAGTPVWACGLDEHYRKIARIMGLTEYLQIVEGEDELRKLISQQEKASQDGEGGPSLPVLQIDCLGPFTVKRGNTTIQSWRRQKGKALLQYLASRRQHKAPVEVVINQVWGEEGYNSNVLNSTVSDLRKDLLTGLAAGGERSTGYVIIRKGIVELETAFVEVDLDRFYSAVITGNQAWLNGETERASALYLEANRLFRSDPLAGEPYYPWMDHLRHHVGDLYGTLMCRLAQWHEGLGNEPAAEEALKELLHQQPYNETAARQMMQLLHRSGRINEVRTIYGRLVERLRQEMSLPPEPQTVDCYLRCTSGKP